MVFREEMFLLLAGWSEGVALNGYLCAKQLDLILVVEVVCKHPLLGVISKLTQFVGVD